MFLRKHYVVSIVSPKTLWGSPWRMLYWYNCLCKCVWISKCPRQIQYLIKREILSYLQHLLLPEQNKIPQQCCCKDWHKCLPRTKERSAVLREATGIVLISPSIFQKIPLLLQLKLEKNKKVISCKLKHFVWLKKISFTLVWMFSLTHFPLLFFT